VKFIFSSLFFSEMIICSQDLSFSYNLNRNTMQSTGEKTNYQFAPPQQKSAINNQHEKNEV
jgi:hypothetical protein